MFPGEGATQLHNALLPDGLPITLVTQGMRETATWMQQPHHKANARTASEKNTTVQ